MGALKEEFSQLPDFPGIGFVGGKMDAWRIPALLPYAQIIGRAWDAFKLDFALCVDNVPTVFFRETASPLSDSELRSLHLSFWSQGVAKTLVLADPQTVRVISSLARPARDVPGFLDSEALVETVALLEFIKHREDFCQATSSGAWYQRHPKSYDPKFAVDSYMLRHLGDFRDQLRRGANANKHINEQTAHAFIGRVLFTCYLVDRGLHRLPEAKSLPRYMDGFTDNHSAKNALYCLFEELREKFNGSMFDQDLEAERQQVNEEHIESLKLFLSGHEVKSRQLTLGFWPYDFSLIPVETISSIYEDFLSREDSRDKKKKGAFYTPRFLAEMALDIAIENHPGDWHKLGYLDPTCGSGIFLVTLFNRLAAHWRSQNPKADCARRARALMDILRCQVRGVDIKPTACQLAGFSLYIALLDNLDDDDIDKFFENHKLPRLLYSAADQSPNRIPVIRCGDLHEIDHLDYAADCLVGNPPWVGRGTKQEAAKIIQKATDLAKPGAVCCFILPSKFFLNLQTNKFQAEWLPRVSLERVVQLADYSFILFEKANCPAMVVRYRHSPPEPTQAPVLYDTPKFSRAYLQRGLVPILHSDRKWLPQSAIIAAAREKRASILWKHSMWGSRRDVRLLNYLASFPPLANIAGMPGEGKRWVKGQGFQPNGKDRNPIPEWWKSSILFVDAKNQCLRENYQLMSADCEPIGDRFDALHRPRSRNIYQPPLLLVSQGFGKVVFADFPVLFQDSLQSISGSEKDTSLLLFLAAYLRSDLARYIMFHSAGNWGSERSKVHLDELLAIPFPLPEDAPAANAAEIIQEVAGILLAERREQEKLLDECRRAHTGIMGISEADARTEWVKTREMRDRKLRVELEPLVARYFCIPTSCQTLVEDTIQIFEPSSTPGKMDSSQVPTLAPITDDNLRRYAETLTSTLNRWAAEQNSQYRVSPGGMVSADAGVAMVSLRIVSAEQAQAKFKTLPGGEFAPALRRGLAAVAKLGGAMMAERELLWIETTSINIIRPDTLLNWTRTAALNDADRIFGELVIAKEAAAHTGAANG